VCVVPSRAVDTGTVLYKIQHIYTARVWRRQMRERV
jgi:hypothetical protein